MNNEAGNPATSDASPQAAHTVQVTQATQAMQATRTPHTSHTSHTSHTPHTTQITQITHSTTALREWLGWSGVMFWLYSMLNVYINIDMPSMRGASEFWLQQNIDYSWWSLILFISIGILSIAGIGIHFKREPNRLGRLAFYTTPAAILCTIAIPILPPPFNLIIYAISPILIAPVLIRRLYGVIYTARPEYVLTTCMTGVTVAFLLMNPFSDFYTDHNLPRVIVFAVFAFALLFAWPGVRRHIGIPDNAATVSKRKGSISSFIIILAAFLLMFTIKKMIDIIFYTVEQFDDFLYIPVYLLLQPILYTVFGFIGDKRKERTSVIIAAGLCIISILLAVVAENPLSPIVAPVVPATMIFYTYIVYFIFVIPINNFKQSKNPVFLASLSLVCMLLQWLFARLVHPFVPKMLMSVGEPLFITTTILSVVLLILLHFIFQRSHDHTLSAALYALLREDKGGHAPAREIPAAEAAEAAETALDAAEPQTQGMISAGLTPEELKVALLLVDGESKRDIARKLNINAAEYDMRETAIRHKLNLLGDHDPIIAAVVAEYHLTKRETEVLRYLRRNAGNDEIATELYLSEDTIKVHVHNLMKKLPVEKRSGIPEWLELYGAKTV